MEQTLGKRIIENRKRLGMTQDKLAEQLGVTAQAVSKWENDQSCPDITMLPRLAEIFGITTDQLLGIAAQQPVHEAQVMEGENQFHVDTGGGQWEMTWDSGRRGALSFALWVLSVGGLLLASNILGWNAGLWDIAWPSAMVVFSLFGMGRRFSFFRLGCALFGGYFLVNNLNIPQLAGFTLDKKLLLPLIILLLGGSLLVDALKKPRKPHFSITHNGKNLGKTNTQCRTEGCGFVCENAFGQQNQYITLPRLQHGTIDSSFGELTVDLTGCEVIEDGANIRVDNAFGQVNVLVPRSCQARVHSDTAFGNVRMVGEADPNAAVTLYLECDCSFGEICVRYV